MTKGTVVIGGCLCGAVRYEAHGPRLDGLDGIVCHCRMCQRASGGAFMALFYMPVMGIQLTRGEASVYRSSPEVERHFCARCGSPLFFDRTNRPDRRAIFVGSLDDPNDFAPAMQVCVSSAVGWLGRLGAAEAFAEKPAGMTPTLAYDPATGRATPRT